jgi:hypothetical protein
MKTFRFVLLGAVTFGVCTGFYLWAYRYSSTQPIWSHDWARNVYLVKEQLASNSPSPRWFLVGGSSVLFGFQSDIIERATGEKVVNLGLHAELPLKFQLWQVERHARAGDTVLLAEELWNFWRAPRYTTYAAVQIGLMAPDYFLETSFSHKIRLMQAVPPARVLGGVIARLRQGTPEYERNLKAPHPEELMRNLRAQWSGAFEGVVPKYYNYLELTQHGDMARQRTSAPHSSPDYGFYGFAPTQTVRREVWSELSSFVQRMHAAQVRCLFTWQPFERHPSINYDTPLVRANLAELRGLLTAAGWTEVGVAEDTILDAEYFYDTPYHLTSEGAKRRTELLVSRLSNGGMLKQVAE